ncbi:hypothetical protein [Roseovarius salinarum]|uniref:hypothetical protein n=1 Tax=Roseovarius salinarum TaxID=1981892 RepID=UPI000C331975|nr:hypothetical protein [Roseovarius salinarum]
MVHWLERLSEESFRTQLGQRVEALTDEAFNVLRWTVLVGFARYVAQQASSIWFEVIYWVLAGLLFGYLASRFLLRPEVPIFAHRDARWKRITQTLVNYALCMAAFMAVIWALDRLVEAIAQYRFGATPN